MSWTRWNGDRVVRAVEEAFLKAQVDTGEVVLSYAKQQVPLDEGTLMRTGTLVVIDDVVYVTFGGGPGTGHPVVPYAIRWHENSAAFQHGRKRFYLKDPLYQVGPEIYKNALRQRLGVVL